MGRQTCLYGLLHLCFLLTHTGKCRASDSHSLISRSSVETPEPVGGPELEKSPFLSPSTSSFHGDLKSPLTLECLRRFQKEKKEKREKKKASSISANINLIQTKIKDKAITFNQKHMWRKKGWVDSNEKRGSAECRERWRELYLCLSRCLRVWFAVF